MKPKLLINRKTVFFLALLLLSASFTSVKAQKAYALWCTGNATLYFTYSSAELKAGVRYDNQTITNAWSGTLVTETGNQPEWNITVRSGLKRVVFDSSFQNVMPKNCKEWFYRCKVLEKVDGLKYLNTSGVTSMMEMFRECEKLTTLDLSQFETDQVSNMESMFNGCKSLYSLDVSKFSSFNLSTTKNMFAGCESLNKLTLVTLLNFGFTCSSVTDMESMFNGCKNLVELDLTNLKTNYVKNMNYMFNNCSKLKTLDLRKFKTNSLVSSDYMFSNCSSLTTIKCNDSWDAKSSTAMFQNCQQLQGAISFDPQKITIAYANPTTGYFYEAVDYNLYICGTRVDNRNCNNLSQLAGVTLTNTSTGKATYDDKTKTLYLGNVDIKSDNGIGIQSSISGLRIRLTGKTNIKSTIGMQLEGNTTITANKEKNVNLTIESSSAGIYIYDKTTTITGGVNCLIKSEQIGVMGRYVNGNIYGNFHMSHGNTFLHVYGNQSFAMGIFNEFELSDELQITYPVGGYCRTEGYKEVFDQNGNVAKEVIIKNPEAPVYDITICGKLVSSQNYKDLTKIRGVSVSNGGYANYDPATNTLRLKNATIEDWQDNLVDCFNHNLTINVEGTNTFRQTSEEGGNALCIRQNTTISGSGTLYCNGGYNDSGIYLHDTLYVDGATVIARSPIYGINGYIEETYYGYHLYGWLHVKEGYGKVIANGRESCIHNLGKIAMDANVKITSPAGATYRITDVDLHGETVKGQDVVIETEEVKYGLRIAEIELTNLNYKKITDLVAETNDESMEAFMDGKMNIQYDPENKMLTLQNVSIRLSGYNDFGIYNKIDDLTIKLIGTNRIESEQWTGIYSLSNGITFYGGGSLTVKGVQAMDLGSNSNNYLRIEGCTISATGTRFGIMGSVASQHHGLVVTGYYTDILLFSSQTRLEVTGGEQCFYDIKSITFNNGLAFTQPAGAIFKNNTVMVGNEIVKGKTVVISKGDGPKKGDVNEDGQVDISDIVAVINQIAGTALYRYADVNSDNKVDISDIVAIINIIAGQ